MSTWVGKGNQMIKRNTAPSLLLSTICLTLCALAQLSCGGGSGEFYIVQNQVAGAGCVIPAGKTNLYQGEGILDIRVPARGDGAYLLFPLLQNDLAQEGEGGVEPNRISLSGFEVDLQVTDASAAVRDFFAALASDPASTPLVRYQSAWSGSVDPGGGTVSAATSVFPAETARRLRDASLLADGSTARLKVLVRAVGQKRTGRIKSDVFSYPIQVCDGCLIKSISPCPASAPVATGGACNPGQDAPVDCCTQGASLICPATSAP